MMQKKSQSQRSFERLGAPLQRWIYRKKWKKLNPIQTGAIPLILDSSSDLLICAATAGGKTEAAFLPLLTEILDTKSQKSGFSLLYVAPLKALISDQWERVERLCEFAKISVTPWHGDISSSIKQKARENPSGVLLITPESLEALFMSASSRIPHLFGCSKTIIIDEYHVFLEGVRGVHLRSLLSRLDQRLGRRIRRVGLSATLGDPELAKSYLCPEDSENVKIIEDSTAKQNTHKQLISFSYKEKEASGSFRSVSQVLQADSYEMDIAEDIFKKFRGTKSLVFAPSRHHAELYAALLKNMCEKRKIPNEFYPHHGHLSKEHRQKMEKELKKRELPRTIICTSTLELGIDIGAIENVAQISSPATVSSLKQRMGRSGRLSKPGNLYLYEAVPEEVSDDAPRKYLYMDFMVSLSMMELIREKRYEPPPALGSLQLSTLIHQILAVLCERRALSLENLYSILCAPHRTFSAVSEELFQKLITHLESKKVNLIQKFSGERYVLSDKAEKIVNFYTFYAAFDAPPNFEVKEDGKLIGIIDNPDSLKRHLLLQGLSLQVQSVNKKNRSVEVKGMKQETLKGIPPVPLSRSFLSLHDMVMEKAKALYTHSDVPTYLCQNSKQTLAKARQHFKQMSFHKHNIHHNIHYDLVATWSGDITNLSLSIWLRELGFRVTLYPGFLRVSSQEGPASQSLLEALYHISTSPAPCADILIKDQRVKGFFEKEKFHKFLSPELLSQDIMSSQLDMKAASLAARRILGSFEYSHKTAA